jgi:hypothetical protein
MPSLWDFLRGLVSPISNQGWKKRPLPADNLLEPVRIVTARVLLVVYDPVMDPATGLTLSRMLKWNRPEDLVTGYIQDILQASNGAARFQIVERVQLNEFPPLIGGIRFTPQSYLDVITNGQPAPDAFAGPTPQSTQADYPSILSQLNIRSKVSTRQIDEVWLFAFPYAGFYESTMAGPGAFWCNAPPIQGSGNSSRRFVVMGFSYERGVGEMLEAFGHRAESILEQTFAHTSGSANLYERFTRTNKKTPGHAEVGSIHFAPNSESDYDWNNPNPVLSSCDDWYRFPAFTGTQRTVTAEEWGNGDIRSHHVWWMKHIPHVAGRTSGVHNNWWQYIADPNLVPV